MVIEYGSARADGQPEGVMPDLMLLQRFYAGDQLPCPLGCGGTITAVRVGTLGDGSGDLWLECGSCAQRERLMIPAATAEERSALHTTPAPGEMLVCPRHRWRVALRNNGRQLVCPECGVRFRE
jgi:hypothetical protein